MRKTTFKKRKTREIILPLTFSHGLKLTLVQLKRRFLKKWQYATAGILMVGLVSGAIFFYYQLMVNAATYGWLQTSWSGGASTTAVAIHPTNQTNWTYYYSKDANVTTTGTVTLSATSTQITETSDGDFNAGTSTGYGLIVSSNAIKMFQCGTSTINDADGNSYNTVLIGLATGTQQCWMASNLKVGTMVTGATTQTNNGTLEKYCYSNDTANCNTYGGLYQWDEAMQYSTTSGARGICPSGWHIPTDAQQHTLDNYLKDAGQTCDAARSGAYDCATAGGKLKETGTTHWTTPNTGATNSSNFTALPAGYRYTDGTFYNLGTYAFFWSSSESGTSAWFRLLYYTEARVFRNPYAKAYGFSVRCLKD